jgi:predicted TIM-barrel fold metal-dependent hydrolase
MIIDVHTHIFPPEMQGDRARFCEGEPAFAAIYADPKAPMVGAEGLVEAMDADQVDVSWAVGFPWLKEDNARLHNDYLMDAVARFPRRLRGLAAVHPPQAWARREAERALASGLHGLGEVAFYDCDLDVASLGPLCRLSHEADRPILLHTNEPVGHQYPGKAPMTLAALYKLVTEHCHTKLILAHMGAGLFFYACLKREVSQALTNVWLDTAAAPFLYRPRAFALALELMGDDKLLMGSDYPLLPVSRYRRELSDPQAGLSPRQMELVMGRNAANLIG